MFAAVSDNVRRSATKRYRNYFLHDPSHPLLRRHTLPTSTTLRGRALPWKWYLAVAFIEESGRHVWYWCLPRRYW